jgi:hypothetical protein
MLTTIILLALLTLLVLAWMATTLTRIAAILEEFRGVRAGDLKCPDSDYPAFSRDQVRHASAGLQTALEESLHEEEKLCTSDRWKAICTNAAPPNDADKHAMYEVAFKGVMWESMLMRLQFLLEANSRVGRGEWSIAQARYLYRDLEPHAFDMAHAAHKRCEEWCQRLASKDRDHGMADYSEKMRPYNEMRTTVLAEWKKQFDALHESKPVFIAS